MSRSPCFEPCPLCGTPAPRAVLDEAGWLPPAVRDRIEKERADWTRGDGACPACVQESLLRALLVRGDEALHAGIQNAWPLDAASAFGALPTSLRMHADPRYTGRGTTLALVDAGFHPHPDLTEPRNRIRAWVDATLEPPLALLFGPDERPAWPGSDAGAPGQWHGLMTSAVAAGNGRLSHGLYRGLASDANLVLVQVREADGRIRATGITRALRWLADHGPELGVKVVSLSVAGDACDAVPSNPVDLGVADLVALGVTVVAAAGNDGERQLVPPATAPAAITVGGLDDKNTFDHEAVEIWHSNYGASSSGAVKPELVAPSLWVVAPILPDTRKASQAGQLFAARARGEESPEGSIRAIQLVTPHYHMVDGTSVAAPLVASVAACALQANRWLAPAMLRGVLLAACRSVAGASVERQGAGALDAGRALAGALREPHGALHGRPLSPRVTPSQVTFILHDTDVRQVWLQGSWDGWRAPGHAARLSDPGIWQVDLPRPAAGRHEYRFLLDGVRFFDDPDNPMKVPDGQGRLNSVLTI